MIGIYKIQSTFDSRAYIGKSKTIEKRKKHHFQRLEANKHHNALLQRFYNKYGIQCLIFDVIEVCEYDKLNEREMFWINEFKCHESGFNMTDGGESNPMDCPINRKKVSDGLKGHKKSKEWIDKIINSKGRMDKNFNTRVKNGSIKYVYAYDTSTHELLYECYGFINMAKHFNLNESNIRQIIYGKMKTAKGVHFSLIPMNVEEISNAIIHESQTDSYKTMMSKITTGSMNGMYGKKHSKKTKELMKSKQRGRIPKNKRINDVDVIDLYLNKKHTQKEIGIILKCTQATVSDILIKNEVIGHRNTQRRIKS